METKDLLTSELNNIEQFISETFNEEEMIEIRGGHAPGDTNINAGTGCGCR